MSELALQGDVVDPDAIAIGELYEKACASQVNSLQHAFDCGHRLAEKKASLPHGAWLPWLKDNAGVLHFETDRTAQRLIKFYQSNATLASDLQTLEIEDAAAMARKLWGHEKRESSQLVQQSESNEHYTPPQYIEAARAVLGTIDLDPASNDIAQNTIQATHYFTAEDDGLSLDWYGKVWLNPPYGRLVGKFTDKLVREYRSENVEAAILLVNAHCTDTSWFQPLWDGVLCFTDHRINFYGDDSRSGSTHGSAFIYFGPEECRFAEEFETFGAIMRRFQE